MPRLRRRRFSLKLAIEADDIRTLLDELRDAASDVRAFARDKAKLRAGISTASAGHNSESELEILERRLPPDKTS